VKLRGIGLHLWTPLFGLTVLSCLVDADAPCGDVFVEADDGSCMCPEGTVPGGERGCSACGEHEIVSGVQCVCEEGFARTSSDEACLESQPEPECEGQCACETSEDCPQGQLCDIHASELCVAPPDGLGQSCSNSSDCTDTEATYCETFSSNTCQIEGCAEANGVCPGDMACCDYSVLARSLCIPAANLEAGACPAPGVLIEREDE
jgi:hypothetical protein